jgi:hypothetical protein
MELRDAAERVKHQPGRIYKEAELDVIIAAVDEFIKVTGIESEPVKTGPISDAVARKLGMAMPPKTPTPSSESTFMQGAIDRE